MDDHDHDHDEDGHECEYCKTDHPLTEEEWAERQAKYVLETYDKIQEHGWVVQAIMASETMPAWSYTLGLRQWDHPEVVVVNLPHQVAHGILNEIGDRVRKGETFEPDTMYDKLIANYAMVFKPVEDPTEGDWFNVAGWVYGTKEHPVLQAFWPDMDGFFPWQEGYDQRYLQDLIGVAVS